MLRRERRGLSRACRSCRAPPVPRRRIGKALFSRMSPVSRPSSIYMTVIPVSVSPARMAAWMGAAPRYRGRSEGVQVEAGDAGQRDPRYGQTRSVGHDDDRFRRPFAQAFDGGRVANFRGLKDGYPTLQRQSFDGGGSKLHPTARRLVGLGDYGHDPVLRGIEEHGQRGNANAFAGS